MRPAVKRGLMSVVSVVALVGAAMVLTREFQTSSLNEISAAIRQIPAWRLTVALLLTGGVYATLPAYDLLGLRYLGKWLGWGRTWMVGGIVFAFSQTVGAPWLVGGSLRLRLYVPLGLRPADVAVMMAVVTVSYWAAAALILGGALSVAPGLITDILPPVVLRVIGIGLVAVVLAYPLFVRRRTMIRLRGRAFRLPSSRHAVAQLAVGSLDWLLAAGILYVLLPPSVGVAFPTLLAVFVAAQVAGLISHVPAGLVVMESVVVLLLPTQAGSPAILGALLVFRLIYNLVPLMIAVPVLLGYEVWSRASPARAP